MLRLRWWLGVMGGSQQLSVYHRFALGEIPTAKLDEALLDAIGRERRDELGRWPMHQEVGARPHPRPGAESVPLVLEALVALSRRYLCWRAGSIELQPQHFMEWREEVGHRLDPDIIAMTAAALDVWADGARPAPRAVDARVLHQITEAPLIPSVALPEVEALKADGLTEIHRHLSLACLPALVWSNALSVRDVELLDAVPHPYLTWSQLLRQACALRTVLLAQIESVSGRGPEVDSARVLLALRTPHPVLDRPDEAAVPDSLPTSRASGRLRLRDDGARRLEGARDGRVSRERALLVHGIRAAAAPHAPASLSRVLHAYLLLRQLTVASIIQPFSGRKGLDRFKDWYVDSGWHGLDDANATQRGVQQAWRTGGVRWLEAKVSSKTATANHLLRLAPLARPPRSLLHRVRFPSSFDPAPLLDASPEAEHPAIRLTFHFLRERDATRSNPRLRRIAFAGLREAVHEQALRILQEAADPEYAPFVVGLDVASLETSAPVEVFAPILRAMRSPWPIAPVRHSGQKRARRRDFGLSIHAGEEFRHLAEGLRRIVETMDFCGYRAGDRLGHALAMGLEPATWARRWGGVAVVPAQVRLDDVVWMWSAIDHLPDHAHLRVRLMAEARRLFRRIYDRPFPDMEVLGGAWRLRAEGPFAHQATLGCYAPTLGPLRRHMRRSLEVALRDAPSEALDIWWDTVSDGGVQRRGAEVLDVDLPSDEMRALRDLQDLVIRRVVRERIAIEVNPSSNLSIGPMTSIVEHPIFRWAPPEGGSEELRPVVVVGSDDPAVFGSELVHEFALLALAAEHRGAAPRAVARWLRELHDDAKASRFEGSLK